jgi:hypothetical protein
MESIFLILSSRRQHSPKLSLHRFQSTNFTSSTITIVRNITEPYRYFILGKKVDKKIRSLIKMIYKVSFEHKNKLTNTIMVTLKARVCTMLVWASIPEHEEDCKPSTPSKHAVSEIETTVSNSSSVIYHQV